MSFPSFPLRSSVCRLPPAGHVALPWSSGPEGPPYVLAPFVPLDAVAIDAVLDALDVVSDDWFLDFGCGNGVVLEKALCRCRRIWGVELDQGLALDAARRCLDAVVLHEPIGWTPAVGPTCGLANLLSWSMAFFASRVLPTLSPGFRLATMDAAPSGLSVVRTVDIVDSTGRSRSVFVSCPDGGSS